MSKGNFCPDCGETVETDWKSCANCNHLLIRFETVCTRCHQLISRESPNFCPYCRETLVAEKARKTIPSKEKQVIDQEDFVLTHSGEFNRDSWKTMMRFDLNAMKSVAGNKTRYSNYTTVILLLVGISSALSISLINLLFRGYYDSIDRTADFLTMAIAIPTSMYLIAMFTNSITNIIGNNSTLNHWKNLVTATFPVFIIKDILTIAISLYVFVFNGDSSIAEGVFYFLLFVSYTVIFFQVLVFLKNWVGISGFASFVITGMIYYFALVFSFVYLSFLIDNLVEALVWLV